jgi:hypothetical protein
LTDQILNARNRPIDSNDIEILLQLSLEGNKGNNDYKGNYPETDDKTEAFILTIIEYRIQKNNLVVAAKMVAKTAKKVTIFKEGSLIISAILLKLHLPTEAKRLVCWVIRCYKHLYLLLTKYRLLKGLAMSGQMNPVTSPDPAVLEEIRMDWPDDTVKIGLTKAVQKLNNCGTIASLQKAGRNTEKVTASTATVVPELTPPALPVCPKRKWAQTDAIQTIEPVLEPAVRRVSSRKGKGMKK